MKLTRIDKFSYYVNQYLTMINPFNMLFILNIDGLVINYINLNDKINKRVICVVTCHPITNWVVFNFVNFDTIIIPIVFGLANIVEYMYVDTTRT